MPGAFGDPFRAIEALPGVTPVVSGLPYFYIRGAPPNDNGYFVDGIRVPLLFHVGIGAGVIHPALIDRVDFFPGAAPAAYGGSAGAIIAGQTRDAGARRRTAKRTCASSTRARCSSHRSATAAGASSSPGATGTRARSSARSRRPSKLGYWDYQARATWRLGDRDTLGVFAFGSHDYLGDGVGDATARPDRSSSSSSPTFTGSTCATTTRSTGGTLRIAATLGHDSQGGAGTAESGAPMTITDPSAALRLELDGQAVARAARSRRRQRRLDATASRRSDRDRERRLPVPSSADPPPTNLTAGAHADVVWRVGPRVELVPGRALRALRVVARHAPGARRAAPRVPRLDPRLSARVTIDARARLALDLGHLASVSGPARRTRSRRRS